MTGVECSDDKSSINTMYKLLIRAAATTLLIKPDFWLLSTYILLFTNM